MLSRLEALHKIGYVHRDIKPNNFLMGGPGGKGPVCLIDMGLTVKWTPFVDPEDKSIHNSGRVDDERFPEKAMTSTPIDVGSGLFFLLSFGFGVGECHPQPVPCIAPFADRAHNLEGIVMLVTIAERRDF